MVDRATPRQSLFVQIVFPVKKISTALKYKTFFKILQKEKNKLFTCQKSNELLPLKLVWMDKWLALDFSADLYVGCGEALALVAAIRGCKPRLAWLHPLATVAKVSTGCFGSRSTR